tara:strand:+ start:2514 stop:2894 length:381 start_codon:yes stop_codon:yes gene_type:complete
MKILDKPIQVDNIPMQTGKYKENKSYIFTDENIKLLRENPFKTYRLRRVEDIKTKKEVHDERARCEGHARYQVRKLERNLGLKLQYKVVSRWIIDGGFVEVYVINRTMKSEVGNSGGGWNRETANV